MEELKEGFLIPYIVVEEYLGETQWIDGRCMILKYVRMLLRQCLRPIPQLFHLHILELTGPSVMRSTHDAS